MIPGLPAGDTSLPDGYVWQKTDPVADLSRVSDLVRACDLCDIGSDDHQEAWIAETWSGPRYRGGIAIEDLTGALVGQADLEAVDPLRFVELFGLVHPEHRSAGLRRSLVGWGEERTLELAGRATTLMVSGSAEDPSFAHDMDALGYRHVRTFWHMLRELPAEDQPPDEPPGVRVRPMDPRGDDAGIFEVIQEAFAGHFGYVPVSRDAWWQEQRSSELYDPGLFFVAEVAEAGDGIVGVASCFLMDDVGWIGELGVKPSFRGRGLGKALLRRSFVELAGRGAGRARLNVDSENEAGATRLYETVGMTVRRAFLVHEKRVGEV